MLKYIFRLSLIFILQAPQCEHAFCASCIQEWLTRQPTCPVDRSPITFNQLKPAPRILRNLLSRLQIACDNAVYGCTAIVKLDALPSHLQECEHNPKKPVQCQEGCGLVIPKDELKVCIWEFDFLCKGLNWLRYTCRDKYDPLLNNMHEWEVLQQSCVANAKTCFYAFRYPFLIDVLLYPQCHI